MDLTLKDEVTGSRFVAKGNIVTGALLVENRAIDNKVQLCANKTNTGGVTTEFTGVATAIQITCSGGTFTADLYESLDGVAFAKLNDAAISADTIVRIDPIASATFKLDVLTNTGSINAVIS